MSVVGITKDGVVHEVIDGKLVPPIVVPDHIHEQLLRIINQSRQEAYDEQIRQEEADKKGTLKE